jgi:hypothetical protein
MGMPYWIPRSSLPVDRQSMPSIPGPRSFQNSRNGTSSAASYSKFSPSPGTENEIFGDTLLLKPKSSFTPGFNIDPPWHPH